MGKFKKILEVLLSNRALPQFETERTTIDIPGHTEYNIRLRPTGSPIDQKDYEKTGFEFYQAMQGMPCGAYDVVERNIVSDLLLRTYTVDELQSLKNDIEKIGNETFRNRKGFLNLFKGRDWETLDMWKILNYAIESSRD